jgi:hypothetical protein
MLRAEDFSIVVDAASNGAGVRVTVRHLPTGLVQAADPAPPPVKATIEQLKGELARALHDPADYRVDLLCGTSGQHLRVVNVRTGRASRIVAGADVSTHELLCELLAEELRDRVSSAQASEP